MSGQWAPFDPSYEYDNSTTDQAEFFDTTFETVSCQRPCRGRRRARH